MTTGQIWLQPLHPLKLANKILARAADIRTIEDDCMLISNHRKHNAHSPSPTIPSNSLSVGNMQFQLLTLSPQSIHQMRGRVHNEKTQ